MAAPHLKRTVSALAAACAASVFVMSLQFATAASEEICDKQLKAVNILYQERTDEIANASAGYTVTVETSTGSVTVPATDAKPTENWFGSPPDLKTAKEFLAAAETARGGGDNAACLAQVENAREALRAAE